MNGRPEQDESEQIDKVGILLYVLLGLFGLLISGILVPGLMVGRWDVPFYQANPLIIPPQIYLYAYVGTMGYVLISIVKVGRPEPRKVSEVLLRVPAALFVITGVYLLRDFLNVILLFGDGRGIQELVLISYSTGLFIEHTIEGLRILAQRLYPGSPSELDSISEPPKWRETYSIR